MTKYDRQRQPKTPPHTSLRNLRRVSGMTLEQVAEAATEILGKERPMNRGSISAIESGIRGASHEVLDALAVVYGLDPGDIVTDYEPRRTPLEVVV